MSQKFIIQLSKTIKKEVIEIYEIEAEDKYQAILEMHKKTDEEKEELLVESEEFEEVEDVLIDILTSEEVKANEHKQRAHKQSEEK